MLGTSPSTRGGISEVIKRTIAINDSQFEFRTLPTHIDKSSRQKFWFFVNALFFILRRGKGFDICHVHFSQTISLLRKALLISILPKSVRIIGHYHAAKATINFSYPEKALIRFIGRRSDKFIVLSEMWAEALKSHKLVRDSKLVVIYNPASQNSFSDFNNERRRQILFAGTLNQRKNYETLLHAFSILAREDGDVSLVLAGNGEVDKAEELSIKLGVRDRVMLLGWVEASEVMRLYRSCAVFCLPSLAEGLPMALIDAWSSDLPVVCSEVGGIADVLKREKAALVVDPSDPNDLAQKLMEVLNNSITREKLVVAGRRLVQKHFDLSVYGRAVATVYLSVAKEGGLEK